MADTNSTLGTVQILGLVDATDIEGTEYLAVVQGSGTRKATVDDVLSPHANNKGNPHETDANQVGLGNVSNDLQLIASKNLSDLPNVQTARDNLSVYSQSESDQKLKNHTDNKDNPHDTDAAQVGLGLVANKAPSDDYTKPTDTMATTVALNKLFTAIQNQSPIGTLLPTFNAANPATYMLCGGTWVLESKGKVLVGYDDSNTAKPVGTSYGASSKSITNDNMPKHSHPVDITSQGHVHGVNLVTAASGGHSHIYSGSTTSFDYGTKSGTTDWAGAHAHYARLGTDSAGGHDHDRGSMNITGWIDHGNDRTAGGGAFYTGSNQNNNGGLNDHRPDKQILFDASRNWTGRTSFEGAHSHTASGNTDGVGDHNHPYSVNIGSHAHNYSGTTATVSDHTHAVQGNTNSSNVQVTGDTGTVGSGSPFNVEQPSLVVYIWRRTA